jgi:hypothetical protein
MKTRLSKQARALGPSGWRRAYRQAVLNRLDSVPLPAVYTGDAMKVRAWLSGTSYETMASLRRLLFENISDYYFLLVWVMAFRQVRPRFVGERRWKNGEQSKAHSNARLERGLTLRVCLGPCSTGKDTANTSFSSCELCDAALRQGCERRKNHRNIHVYGLFV